MRETYGQQFVDDMRKVELSTQEFLFGGRFGEKIENRATAVSNEKTLTESESSLLTKKNKKSKKSKKASKTLPSSQGVPSTKPSTSKAASFPGKKRQGGAQATRTQSKSKRSKKGSGKSSSA